MQIIDLTRTIVHGQPGVSIESKYRKDHEGWNASTYEFYSHSGTHLDAPFHFLNDGQTLEQLPLEKFIKKAVVADITHLAPKALIEIEDITKSVSCDLSDSALILKSGWSTHFENHQYYRDNFPRISVDLARWLTQQNVAIVAVEPPSVADVNNLEEVTKVHEILLGAGIVIVEGLVCVDKLPKDNFEFNAIPLKVHHGDGSPCRAFGIIH